MPPKKKGAAKGKKAAAAVLPPEDIVTPPNQDSAAPVLHDDMQKVNGSSKWPSNGPFDNSLVTNILHDDMLNNFHKLDSLGYLEKYLWKHVNADMTFEHMYSIIVMMNAKFAEGINAFDYLHIDDGKFDMFFKSTVKQVLMSFSTWTFDEKTTYSLFLTNTFKRMENEDVRRSILCYLSLPLWDILTPERLAVELEEYPHLQRHWDYFQEQKSLAGSDDVESVQDVEDGGSNKKRKGRKSTTPSKTKKARVSKAADASSASDSEYDKALSAFVPSLLEAFMQTIETDHTTELMADNKDALLYTERFLELLIDLMSQLPTRRFLSVVLDDIHVLVRIRRSSFFQASTRVSVLLHQQVNLLDEILHFDIEEQTGKALSAQEVTGIANARLHSLQRVAYTHYREQLQDLAFSSTGELGKEENLRKHFAMLSPEQLQDIAEKMGYISASKPITPPPSVDFIIDVLVYRLAYRKSQLDSLGQTSLYPTGNITSFLWLASFSNCALPLFRENSLGH
jgi:intron-binding protein aquarius